MAIEATICYISGGGKVLLKTSVRGISKGYWNLPGGKIQRSETPRQCVVREVFEETSLKIKNVSKNGTMRLYDEPEKLFYIIHVFSSANYDGVLHSTEEGQVKWFDINAMPFEKMWGTARYVMSLIIQGKIINASFLIDKRRNVIGYRTEKGGQRANSRWKPLPLEDLKYSAGDVRPESGSRIQ